MTFNSIVTERNCYKCIHINVCYLYDIVRENYQISRPPVNVNLLLSPANIGSVCTQYKLKRVRKTT